MSETHNTKVAAGLERGALVKTFAALALLGLIGYLATGSLARGAVRTHATVSLKATSFGKVLVNSRGHTIYLFTKDKLGKSSCSGQCAVFWPPVIDASKPIAGAGLKASLLGRTKRADGRMQVTYNHHPLYLFKLDTKAGQVSGEGVVRFGGSWWVMSARGLAVKKAPAAPTTTTSTTMTTTTTSGGGGYGAY